MRLKKAICLLLSTVLAVGALVPTAWAMETTDTISGEASTMLQETTSAACAECGGINVHLETCSQYVAPAIICSECFVVNGHAETCSQYIAPAISDTNVTPTAPLVTISAADLFYDAVMATQTSAELEALLAQYTNEQIQLWLTEMGADKQTALSQHVSLLYPSEPVASYHGIANTNAAPFLPAVQGWSFFSMRGAETENDGLVLGKTTAYNDVDNTCTVTLEAYVTGSVTISNTDKAIPTDIVLVLDSSKKMDNYITIGEKTDLSVLDTKYGAAEGVYQLEDGVLTAGSGLIWRDMKYENGKWYYKGWGWQDGNWIEVGSRINVSSATNIRIKKIDALKIAAQRFVDYVNANNTDTSGNTIGHQIAVVDFDDDGTTSIGLTDVGTGSESIKTAITSLTADGAVGADYGMQRAKDILDAIPTNRTSNRVVIMMTGDEPSHNNGIWGYFEDVKGNTISTSNKIKNENGATVYTIGVFENLDTTVPMPSDASDLNKYMHYVSSNFKDAQSMNNPGTPTYPTNGSYYLGANDATQLNEIFKKISQQIQTGGASINLGAETLLTDVVADQFDAPTTINVYTAPYNGYDGDGERNFGGRSSLTGVSSSISGKTITVSGFDFSSSINCVTDTTTAAGVNYSGNKLIIEFTVKLKDGFLGGNDVTITSDTVTNGSYSKSFPTSTLNFPINEITITGAEDKNVYLMQDFDVKQNVIVKCGNVDITDTTKLESWQTNYVNINTTVEKSAGFNATADGSYTVTAVISPKSNGGTADNYPTVATVQTKTETKQIHVFKPELTFKDSTVYYGDTFNSNYSGNHTQTRWIHTDINGSIDKVAGVNGVTVLGTAPTLDLTYKPESGKIEGDKINTKNDIAVDVSVIVAAIVPVDITAYTKFVHTKCDTICTDSTSGKFWLHVRTCQLTISKTGGSSDESYVFYINRNGEKYTEATVASGGSVTIYELPVGTYTVVEDRGWSWRYTPSYGVSSAVTLSNGNGSGTVTCTNTNNNNNYKWLNGFSRIVKNTYGEPNYSN